MVAPMTEPTPRKPSTLAVATDLLAPLVPRLLVAFAALRPGRPPQSLRALQPLALVLMLEAFGLASLLTDEQRAAAWQAARGPGRGKADDDAYDPTDDSDETKALRWVAARAAAEDKAYRDHARATFADKQKRGIHLTWTIAEFINSNYAPDRAEFSRQWGERNPIDPATAPACFDPRAQLSILDAVSPERDGALGLFVAESRLRAEAPPVLTYMGHTLDLTGCTSLADAAWRAITERWIAYLDHRGSTVGLRLLPPTDGIRVRLRAPLVNVLAADEKPAPSAPVEFGAFVLLTRLVTGTVTVEHDGQRLSLHGCRAETSAAARAVVEGWSVKPCVRDGLPGLLFAPAERIVVIDVDDDSLCSSDCAKDHSMPDPNDPTTECTPRELTEHDGYTPDGYAFEPDPDVAPSSARAAEIEREEEPAIEQANQDARVPYYDDGGAPECFTMRSAPLALDLTIGDAVRFTSGPHTGRIAHVFEVSADKPKAQLVGRKVEIVDAIDVPADAVEVVGQDPDDASLRPSALTKRSKKRTKSSGVEGKARAKDGKRRAT